MIDSYILTVLINSLLLFSSNQLIIYFKMIYTYLVLICSLILTLNMYFAHIVLTQEVLAPYCILLLR